MKKVSWLYSICTFFFKLYVKFHPGNVSSSNLGVRLDCMGGIDGAHPYRDIDGGPIRIGASMGAIRIGASWTAMTRCSIDRFAAMPWTGGAGLISSCVYIYIFSTGGQYTI